MKKPLVYKFKVVWGEGYSQRCTSKREALAIAKDLLDNYDEVNIEKISE